MRTYTVVGSYTVCLYVMRITSSVWYSNSSAHWYGSFIRVQYSIDSRCTVHTYMYTVRLVVIGQYYFAERSGKTTT